MGHGDEGIVLTERERETLAQLAESIGDPWLARQLTGQDPTGRLPRRRRRPARLRIPGPPALPAWAGVLLVAAGAALTLATFVASTALATAGLVLMGAGLWGLARSHRESLARRRASDRAVPRPETPAAQPPPPRTPPGAA